MLNCRVIGSHAWCLYCQALILQEMCIQIDNIPNSCRIASILTGWHNTNTVKCIKWCMQQYVRLILLTDHDRQRQAHCVAQTFHGTAQLSSQHACCHSSIFESQTVYWLQSAESSTWQPTKACWKPCQVGIWVVVGFCAMPFIWAIRLGTFCCSWSRESVL